MSDDWKLKKESQRKAKCLPYWLKFTVPLIFPSGKICKYINARADHNDRGSVKLGGRIGVLGRPSQRAFSTPEVKGLGLFAQGFLVARRFTFPFDFGRFARVSDGFDRTKIIAMRKLHVLVRDIVKKRPRDLKKMKWGYRINSCYMLYSTQFQYQRNVAFSLLANSTNVN